MSAYAKVTVDLDGQKYEADLAAYYEGIGKRFFDVPDMPLSPMATFYEIKSGTWGVKELKAVITAAIIGGGCGFTQAPGVVSGFVSARPMAQSAAMALEILGAFLFSRTDGAGDAIIG